MSEDSFKFLTNYLATFSGEDVPALSEAKEKTACNCGFCEGTWRISGLVHEECIAKMRLMSLVDLSSDGSGQFPYELIRDTLQINDDEVELWVVKAITAKLIDCKMDQMNQVVVSHHTDRVFGQHRCQTLRTKLVTWRGNIANVISTIQANKVTEDGSRAAQGLVVR